MSNIAYVAFSIVSIIFLYTPYLRGLFFDADFYFIELVVDATFIIYSVWLFVTNRIKSYELYWIVFLIPFIHFLSFFGSETAKGALDNLFRWTAYSSFFIVLIWIQANDGSKKLGKVMPILFHLTGTWISFFALFGLWEWIEFKDVMLVNRMTGPFQYANTFATVICAFLLFALVQLTRSSLKLWETVFYCIPLISYGVGIFHSYSRGTLVILPIAWLVGLLILKGRAQFEYLLFSLLANVGSIAVFRQMTLDEAQKAANPGITIFIITSVALIVVIRFVKVFMKNGSFWNVIEKPMFRFGLPIGVILVGVLLALDIKLKGMVFQALPQTLQQRVSDINTETLSVLGRTNVYKDAWEISKESPAFGVGGEGWKVVYPAHQQIPYLNNEVHNGYLEILVSTGWVGMAVFLVVFAVLIKKTIIRIRNSDNEWEKTVSTAALVALSMMFLHAIIDFDFSYGTVWFIVFWLFAMAVPIHPVQNTANGHRNSRAVLLVVTIGVFISGVYTTRFYLANNLLSQTNVQVTLDVAEPLFEKVTALNPYQTDYLINLANVYAAKYKSEGKEDWKSKAVKQLKSAESLEPNNSNLLFSIGRTYLMLGDWQEADQYFTNALDRDKFNVQLYDASIQLNAQVAYQLTQQKQKEQALSIANNVVERYADYVAKIEPFKMQEIPDKRPLELSNKTYFFLGQSYLLLGQYQQGVKFLKLVTDPQLVLEAQALLVVAFEEIGRHQEAAGITQKFFSQHPNFVQKVVLYKSSIITN
ncbi:O-antigen ligase family protein [Brevibacillus sp. H7]|uniref:O-antigen ligase family protein n=1 Tax=Brevibacillus sp. H7 TaxID=3349138 RepID=UPI0038302E2D